MMEGKLDVENAKTFFLFGQQKNSESNNYLISKLSFFITVSVGSFTVVFHLSNNCII